VTVAKWQATGNAYLIIPEATLGFAVTGAGATLLCDPRQGIGADGVLVLSASAVSDMRMLILNPDGSESQACGNGTRMVARYLTGLAPGRVTIETTAGILDCVVHADSSVTARMADAALTSGAYQPTATPFPYPHRFVSVGNPHVTIRVDDPDAFPLATEGASLEHHPWLPERANIEVWQAESGRVRMRVWERGVGETDACGTGACAVAVAAVLDGAAISPVEVMLPGGVVTVDVTADLSIRITGPAEPIAQFTLDSAFIDRLRTL
jgi:diaminopimelate epimerase